ncbi:hypothetical protein EXT46_04395 [Pseudoalteromonas sp. CO325X]|uniref:hypothetical protein n=1 Tax=Pseudoalteromonas sp. CO325X TaxID=1777262 RepID=UPI001023CBD1|nr:hypothetical protein [Pseudoalteromonas sp. CO325X]RZF84026.1 hypothetical protein EXT46_04395 [Pseudoalteromonas sp. CO325X]
MSTSIQDVLILGNAPIKDNLAAQVDAFERVVRFNFCAGMPVNLGSKCTDLWLTGRGRQAAKLLQQPIAVDLGRLQNVVITDPPAQPVMQSLFRLIRRQGKYDHGAALLAKFAQSQSGWRVSKETRKQLLKRLHTYGKPQYKPVCPSSGTLAIDHFLQQGHRVTITGFGFQGWKRHPWDLEQRYVAELVDTGKLQWLT